MKTMKSRLIILLLLLVVTACYPGESKVVKAINNSDGGWQLIGEIGLCKLYRKEVQNNPPIYWSICTSSSYSSAITQ